MPDLSFIPSVIGLLVAIGLVGLGINVLTSHDAPKSVGGVLMALGVGMLILVAAIVQVPAGSVGILLSFGKVQDATLPPGLHVVMPFVNNVVNIDTRVQPHQFADIDASTQENLSVKVSGTMNYHIDGAFANQLYQTVGTDFASKVIDPAFADYIKQVTPAYSADSGDRNFILAKRDEIRQLTKTQLGENLSRYHIIVDDIYIVNIAYPKAYEDSIIAKQVAQQQVQTESQVLQQKTIQAKQAVAVATGQADATAALAAGQAKANDLLTKSLTPELIQYTLITKLSDKIQVMLLPAGQNFILDPKTLLAPKPQ